MKKRNCKDCIFRRLAVCQRKGQFVHQQHDEFCEFCETRAVFLCYEENRHQLASECGAIEELKAFGSKGKAIAWAMERVKHGTDDGYIIDTEYGEVTRDRLFDELAKDESVDITMFNGYQENWDVSYDIVARKVEVEE